MLIRFFRDSSGIAAIDYLFVVALAYGVERLPLGQGAAASAAIKRLLGLG